MKLLNTLKNEKKVFLNFMKEKYHLSYRSNMFLRDLQYAIYIFFLKRGKKLSYTEAEELALAFAKDLTEAGELKQLNKQTWTVNFKLETEKATEENAA